MAVKKEGKDIGKGMRAPATGFGKDAGYFFPREQHFTRSDTLMENNNNVHSQHFFMKKTSTIKKILKRQENMSAFSLLFCYSGLRFGVYFDLSLYFLFFL